MSVCEHDKYCPGFGTAHDAQLTPTDREQLDLPLGKDLSQKKVKRLLRTARKKERELLALRLRGRAVARSGNPALQAEGEQIIAAVEANLVALRNWAKEADDAVK